jgi:hypothetical protein
MRLGDDSMPPRSADGSLDKPARPVFPDGRRNRGSTSHGRQLDVCMGAAGWGALSEAAFDPCLSAPSSDRGVLTRYGSRFALLHHCFAAAGQTFNSKHSIRWASLIRGVRLCATE